MIEQIGRHRVQHGNIMYGIKGLIPEGSVDFIYSDPPWGTGNLKYWQTQNIKNNGGERFDTELPDFLDNLFTLIKDYSKPSTIVFIEYGLRWVDIIEQYAAKIDLQIHAISTPVYGSPRRPLKLFTMAYRPLNLPKGYQESIDNTTGFTTLLAATKPFEMKGKSILDPCCGLGYTAKLAVYNQAIFYGNELNESRLENTKKILRR